MKGILATAIVLLTCSCITVQLAGGSSEQTIYRLECTPPAPGPEEGMDIRVRDFSCSSEYERTGMVLVDSAGVVTRASSHRWASSPAVSLSDLIARDLLVEDSFSAVLRRSVMEGSGAILEGHVGEFGARQFGGAWHAVIDTDLILFDAVSGDVIAQRHIELSAPMRSTGFAELARAMSELAIAWSGSARAFIHEALMGVEK